MADNDCSEYFEASVGVIADRLWFAKNAISRGILENSGEERNPTVLVVTVSKIRCGDEVGEKRSKFGEPYFEYSSARENRTLIPRRVEIHEIAGSTGKSGFLTDGREFEVFGTPTKLPDNEAFADFRILKNLPVGSVTCQIRTIHSTPPIPASPLSGVSPSSVSCLCDFSREGLCNKCWSRLARLASPT